MSDEYTEEVPVTTPENETPEAVEAGDPVEGGSITVGLEAETNGGFCLPEAQLGPAGNVIRIEILDGATLDIPGLSGQVANVVVRAGGITGQWAWRPEFRRYFTDPLFTRFEASLSGRQGPVEYTLAVENQSSHSGAGGLTVITDANGNLLDLRDDVWTGEFEQPRISGRFVIDGPGSSVGNLNLSYRQFWYDYVENGLRVPVQELFDDSKTTPPADYGFPDHAYEDLLAHMMIGESELLALLAVRVAADAKMHELRDAILARRNGASDELLAVIHRAEMILDGAPIELDSA